MLDARLEILELMLTISMSLDWVSMGGLVGIEINGCGLVGIEIHGRGLVGLTGIRCGLVVAGVATRLLNISTVCPHTEDSA